MAVLKYRDPETGEVKTVGAPAPDYYTKEEQDTKLEEKAALTHAEQHAAGGSDEITPEMIGAAPGGLISGIYNANPATDEVVDGILDDVILEMATGTSRFIIINAQTNDNHYIKGGYNFVRIDKTADSAATIQTSTYSPVTGGFNATRTKLNNIWYPWGETLHEGNGVKKSGDTMGKLTVQDKGVTPLIVENTTNTDGSFIQFSDTTGRRGDIGIYSNGEPMFKKPGADWYKLFHAGNLYDTFTCALESGITGSVTGFVCGKVAHISGRVVFDTPVTERKSILIIPAGFRPIDNINASPFVITCQSTTNGLASIITNGFITNGVMRIGDTILGSGASAGIKQIEFSLMYMVK